MFLPATPATAFDTTLDTLEHRRDEVLVGHVGVCGVFGLESGGDGRPLESFEGL